MIKTRAPSSLCQASPPKCTKCGTDTVAPHITQLQPEPVVIRHYRIKCFGVGESKLEAMLPDLIRRDRQPRVGITVSDATITLRITATAADEDTCFTAMQPTIETIRDALGDLIFGQEDDELEDAVVHILQDQNKTIAIADLATEGLVLEWLKRVNANHSVLRGENVNYDSFLTNPQADDPDTAVSLAETIRNLTTADIGLAIAAYPNELHGPDSHVAMAIATPEQTKKLRFPCAAHPAIIRPRTAKQALNAVRLLLK